MFRNNELPKIDLQARQAIRSWQGLAAKGRQLQRHESKLLDTQFQPETLHPERIGMDEYTDQYSPEELIALCTQSRPSVVDWDALEVERSR
jgi:hypothetical protein